MDLIPISLHDTHSHHTVPSYCYWPAYDRITCINPDLPAMLHEAMPKSRPFAWELTPASGTSLLFTDMSNWYNVFPVSVKSVTEPQWILYSSSNNSTTIKRPTSDAFFRLHAMMINRLNWLRDLRYAANCLRLIWIPVANGPVIWQCDPSEQPFISHSVYQKYFIKSTESRNVPFYYPQEMNRPY